MCFLCICLFCTRQCLFFFSSSWCQRLAVACHCGTPWTFLLTFCGFLCCLVIARHKWEMRLFSITFFISFLSTRLYSYGAHIYNYWAHTFTITERFSANLCSASVLCATLYLSCWTSSIFQTSSLNTWMRFYSETVICHWGQNSYFGEDVWFFNLTLRWPLNEWEE